MEMYKYIRTQEHNLAESKWEEGKELGLKGWNWPAIDNKAFPFGAGTLLVITNTN